MIFEMCKYFPATTYTTNAYPAKITKIPEVKTAFAFTLVFTSGFSWYNQSSNYWINLSIL